MASLRKATAQPGHAPAPALIHPATEPQKMPVITWDDIKSISVAVLYVAVSTGMTFFNKAVLSHFKFDFELTILFVQLIFTIIVLRMMESFGLIPALERITMARAKQMLVVSLLYSANVAIALSALASLNIPMYSTLKRLTVCFALVGEYLILGRKPAIPIVLCVIALAVGAIVAGFGDLEFSLYGYLLGLASCLSQTGYLLFVVKREKESGMSTFSLFYVHSVLSLPFVGLATIVTGELSDALAYPDLTTTSFIIALTLSSLFGALLNYTIFLCAVVNSPLTLLVSGQFKSIFTVGVGIFTFGGVAINSLNIFGWSLNSLGSLGYAYLKYLEKHASSSPVNNNANISNNNGVESLSTISSPSTSVISMTELKQSSSVVEMLELPKKEDV